MSVAVTLAIAAVIARDGWLDHAGIPDVHERDVDIVARMVQRRTGAAHGREAARFGTLSETPRDSGPDQRAQFLFIHGVCPGTRRSRSS